MCDLTHYMISIDLHLLHLLLLLFLSPFFFSIGIWMGISIMFMFPNVLKVNKEKKTLRIPEERKKRASNNLNSKNASRVCYQKKANQIKNIG